MKKKILILGLSCNLDDYIKEEKFALNTWGRDIKEYDNFELYFFKSGECTKIDTLNNIIYVQSHDEINYTWEKTLKALKLSLLSFDFDWVILTNTATVLNIKLIDQFVNSDLINEDNYYGCELMCPVKIVPFFRGNFIMLSRKTLKSLDYDFSKNLEGDNDIQLFDYLCSKDNVYKTFLSKLIQVNGITDIKNIKLNNIGSNFCINTKIFDRTNPDLIILNIVGCSSLIFSDKNSYDLKKLIWSPKYMTANNGIFEINKISEESRISGN